MHYYKYHIGDNLLNTIGLSMIEEGAYRRLVDMYYAKGSLPKDFAVLCRLVRVVKKAEMDAVRFVLAEFFEETDDGYINRQVDESLEEASDKSDKARKMVEARWNKKNSNTTSNTRSNTTSNTRSNTTSNTRSNTIHKPITNINNKERGEYIESIACEENFSPPVFSDENTVIDVPEIKERAAITTYLRSQGINATSNQKTDNLIEKGAKMQHFVDAVSIAKSKNKSSFDYILGTVKGLLEDEKNIQSSTKTEQKYNQKFDPVAWVKANPANQQHGLQPIGNFIDVPVREVSNAE